jgi:hypothetical protein
MTLYQVRVITVFTVFRLLTDFVCLYNYEFWLSLCKIVRSSVILLLPLFKVVGSWCSFCPNMGLPSYFLVLWFPLRFLLNNDAQFVLPPVVCSRAHVLFMLFVFACVTYVLTTPVTWGCLIRSSDCLHLTVPIFLDFCVVFCLPNVASFSELRHGFLSFHCIFIIYIF